MNRAAKNICSPSNNGWKDNYSWNDLMNICKERESSFVTKAKAKWTNWMYFNYIKNYLQPAYLQQPCVRMWNNDDDDTTRKINSPKANEKEMWARASRWDFQRMHFRQTYNIWKFSVLNSLHRKKAIQTHEWRHIHTHKKNTFHCFMHGKMENCCTKNPTCTLTTTTEKPTKKK